MHSPSFLRVLLLSGILATWASALHSAEPFKIVVVDAENDWPVPLVQLTTTHQVHFVTDNAGVIAFDLPELMNREVWLTVKSHGYKIPADGFGFTGVRVNPTPGGTATIKINRQLPGKRLGRITGAGLFAESQKCGEHLDWVDQGIVGCDSVQNTRYGDQLFWGWGDTNLAKYPLGIFHMLGATTSLQPLGQFQPPIKLRYEYISDAQGAPRAVAPLPGPGPTWLGGYVNLLDAAGREHLVATYAKIKPPMDVYEYGLCEFNNQQQVFEAVATLWTDKSGEPSPQLPLGHVSFWTDDQGKRWALFGDPFPSLMYPATYEAWKDAKSWVSLKPQTSVPSRDGKEVKPHRGAIAWNEYRNCWVSIFTQLGGEASYLGELWYAESPTPQGPWGNALKVVTHDQYTFYNPQLHPSFTDPQSPILLFEATYTKEFSGNKSPTPRYDYNQVLYRLDLNEPVFQSTDAATAKP